MKIEDCFEMGATDNAPFIWRAVEETGCIVTVHFSELLFGL